VCIWGWVHLLNVLLQVGEQVSAHWVHHIVYHSVVLAPKAIRRSCHAAVSPCLISGYSSSPFAGIFLFLKFLCFEGMVGVGKVSFQGKLAPFIVVGLKYGRHLGVLPITILGKDCNHEGRLAAGLKVTTRGECRT